MTSQKLKEWEFMGLDAMLLQRLNISFKYWGVYLKNLEGGKRIIAHKTFGLFQKNFVPPLLRISIFRGRCPMETSRIISPTLLNFHLSFFYTLWKFHYPQSETLPLPYHPVWHLGCYHCPWFRDGQHQALLNSSSPIFLVKRADVQEIVI